MGIFPVQDPAEDLDGQAAETPVTEVQVTAHGALLDLVNSQHLRIVYQPIVNMQDGTVFGYEALLRCLDPRFKGPVDLLRRAAECARTGALGRVVRQLAIPSAPPLPLFINIHPDEFSESWLLRGDDPAFSHPRDLYLEITETVPLGHFGKGHRLFETLQSHPRLHLVVDDLGAGFSNLKRIADLEPEVVKVDRELVTGIGTCSRQRRLLKAIVRLCEDLGARVVAEGIETVDEYLAVRDAGAHFGQGYLLARPAFPEPSVFWRP
ncbi:MAG TPA: EAL domain-containing protein [Polyangiaceae bacterium]|jgi:EAL domain-containing protein (putative c-di-GMP-specific phosphodiesterase class I)|nr:EAL domain-containing protein [Polyangiaceae bacterium]